MSLWNGTMLLPTMLGSFHFYENKTLSEYGIETLLPTMLGSFHFYGTPSEAQ